MNDRTPPVSTIWFQNPDGELLKEVAVTLLGSGKKVLYKGETDPGTGKISLPQLKPGKYRMEAVADGYEPLHTGIELTGKPEEEVFFIGRKKTPYLFFGGKKVFLKSKPRELGVVFVEKEPAKRVLNRLLPEDKVTAVQEFGRQEGFSKKLKAKTKAIGKELSAAFRRSKKVAFAGMVLETPAGEAIPTGEIFIQLYPEVDVDEFLKKLKKETKDFKWVRNFSLSEEFVAIQYTGEEDEFLDKANALETWEEVYALDFGLFFGLNTPGQVFPGDSLRQGQYHLIVTGMPQAWQILQDNGVNFGGNPDVIVAVPDEGVQTAGAAATPTHSDFNANIVGGALTGQLTTPNPGRKIYLAIDYRTNTGAGLSIVLNNNNVVGNHGMQCAGVVGSFSDGANGAVGVGPNLRLIGTIDAGFTATNVIRLSDAHTHLTGFDPNWTPAQYAGGQQFPRNFKTPGLLTNRNANATLNIPDGPACDVISFSFSNPIYSNLVLHAIFNNAARLGRKRRGTINVGLAQNACQPFRNNSQWGPDISFMVVAASGLDHLGRETKAGYSNYARDLTPGIDVCAPSGTAMGGAFAPPLTVGVLTPTLNTTGNTNDTVTTTRVLLADANPGDMNLNANTAGLPVSSTTALLQRANNPHVFEWVIIVPPGGGLAGNNYPLQHPVRNTYRVADGDRIVFFSNANRHWNKFFSGTSAATPQVAGLAALMISINPQLNWLDVRRLLRSTAVPIDIRHRGPLPQNITTGANYTDTPGNVIHATDFNWFEFNAATPQNMATANPLLDANGQLDLRGAAIMSAAAPNYPANNNTFQQYFINMGPPPGGNPRFRKRQAILIGAETTLSTQVPYPNAGPDLGATNFIEVANGNGFTAGDIIIGRDTQTILQITAFTPAGTPTTNLDVVSTDGFQIGDQIQIQLTAGNVVRTITGFGGNGIFNHGVTGSSTRITINANITTAAGDNGVIVQRDPATWERATIAGRAGNRINLTANLANAFNPGAGTIVVRTADCEIRVVKDVQVVGGNERLEVDKFHHNHTAPVRVTGGRIADYSFMYGYGRIDGPAAVTAALNYFGTPQNVVAPPVDLEDQYPDVHIRNTLADTGTAPTNLVHSPDIWLRKANDMLANMPAMGDEGPHEDVLPEFRFIKYEGTAAHDDLMVTGDYTGAVVATYVISNDGAGNFSWTKDGVAAGGPTAINANNLQVVMDGLQIMFGGAAYDGSEKWTIRAESANRNCFIRVKNRGLMGTFVPNTMAAGLPVTPDFYQVRFFIHLTNGSPVIRYQGAGGMDDLEVRGTFNQAVNSTFTIIIDGTPGGGAADTFSHQVAGGGVTAGVAITGNWQNIGNGIEIRFRNLAGHAGTDRWELLARPNTNNDRFHSLEDFVVANPTVNPFSFQLNRAGTHLLGTINFSQSIDSGVGGFNPSLAHNQTRLFTTLWGENRLPLRKGAFAPKPASPLRMFLMAECVPHDGPTTGETPATNNNLSYREVLFAHFEFRNSSGTGEFQNFIEVDSFGTVLNETMNVDFISDSVTFTTENLEIELKMEFENGTSETKIFKYTGGSWQFSGGNPTWATIDPPKIGTSATLATNEQYQVRFAVKIKADRNQTAITVKPKIFSGFSIYNAVPLVGSNPLLASGEKRVPVYEQAELPSGRYGEVTPADLAPKSHFFTRHDLITQVAAKAYGPVSGNEANQYRVTTLLNAASEPQAYAVVDGIVMVQRDPGNNLVVNLILKPFKQAMLGFTPVRYFIYRGIKLDNILRGTNATDEKLVRNQAGASAWIDSLWNLHTAQNGAVPFESKALGYDPVNQNGADLLDSFFYRSDPDFQLPFVSRGAHLGNFLHSNGGNSYDFGFEVVLEEGEFQLDLDYVRKTAHLVDVSGLPSGTAAEKFDLRLKREEILRYIDPAAFFGMHNSDKGWLMVDDGAGNKTKLTGGDIFHHVTQKFQTKNALYIDVRNENGLSYNFYGKYDDGTASHFALGVGATAVVADQKYETHSWPILIQNRPSAAIANDYNEVHLRFRKDYNKKPILYLEHGRPLGTTTKGKFIADADLYPAGAVTNVLGFRYPNHDLGGGNKEGNPWLLKMHYGLRIDATNPSHNEVPKTEKYLDNFFGPLSLNPNLKWAGSYDFSWLTAQDKKFIDGLALGFEHVADRGVAIEDAGPGLGRVLFYGTAKEVFSNTNVAFVPTNGMTGGVSKKGSFFQEAQLFGGYNLFFDTLDIAGTKITTLKLQESALAGRPLDGMMVLGISKAEYNTLKGLAGFETQYPGTVYLEADAGNPLNSGGKSYDKYKIGVRGMDQDGKAKTAFPASDIFVYSVDNGLFFFSDAFSADEPLPSVYLRNYEEGVGAQKRIPRNFPVKSVNQASKQFLIDGIDLTKEIFIDDKITIKNSGNGKQNDGDYTVTAVTFNGTETVVTVSQAIPGNPATKGELHEMEQPYEDFFIKKDTTVAALGGVAQMKTLVDNFVAAVTAAPNSTAGLANLEAAVNLHAPEILDRARKLCANAASDYADDRILYWARIKMLVALKSHPFLLQSLGDRNKLVKIFEEKSRGYASANFSAAPGGTKKVLAIGFDPVQLGGAGNILQSNPSGAAALALHGQTLPGGAGANVYVETIILPARYEDFHANNGKGLVESRLERYLKNTHPQFVNVDMIVTLSQGGELEFWVDRFAARYRGGNKDNENLPPSAGTAFKFPDNVTGKEFYETSLNMTKIDAMANGGRVFPVYYNHGFSYNWTGGNATNNASLGNAHFADSNDDIENASHPQNAQLAGQLVPTALTAGTNPKEADIRSFSGGSGNGLENEVFYRVKRLEDEIGINLGKLVGHIAVPKLQHKKTVVTKHGQSTTQDFDKGKTKTLIAQLASIITDAVQP